MLVRDELGSDNTDQVKAPRVQNLGASFQCQNASLPFLTSQQTNIKQ